MLEFSSKLMGEAYDKADSKIYEKLLSRQEGALRNALKLEESWEGRGHFDPEKANPSTTVHKLVGFLNGFLDPSGAE